VKILVLFAHPLSDSFNAAIHRTAVEALRAGGHEVDDLDLYAENFQPVLSADERRHYHDLSRNRIPAAPYIERLQRAEAVIFMFPTWSFGMPAIMKGWFDRVMIPGVSFRLNADGVARPNLQHIRQVVGVSTYGRPWWQVRFIVGDLPRRQVAGYFRRATGGASTSYLALYDMNRVTQTQRERFLARVRDFMTRL
jgi:NAD(P)H dehydrogenase (quinone)